MVVSYKKQSREFSHYVFATFTVDRRNPVAYEWSTIGKKFNRYIQNLRRLHNDRIQYIRAIESHEDCYPHIHTILRFTSTLSIDNGKYFDKRLYQKWKQLWPSGFSDYAPTLSSGPLPIRYLLKYLIKQTHTYKTLWRNYYQCLEKSSTTSKLASSAKNNLNVTLIPQESAVNAPIENSETSNQIIETEPITPKNLSTLLFCKSFNVKPLSWSRQFFSLSPPSARRPETISLLTSAF
jgi:transposase